LLDNSLLQREHRPGRAPRFRMLETVRAYALERLAGGGSGDVHRRHAEYFARFAELTGPDLIGPHAETTLDLVSTEHDNFSAALDTALHTDLELGFRLVAALRSYWETAARGAEVRDWLAQSLPNAPCPDTPARVGASVVFGRQLSHAGDYEAAMLILDRAAADAQRLGSPGTAALALAFGAWLRSNSGDHAAEAQLGTEAIALAQQADDLWVERLGHAVVANTLLLDGDHARARVSLDQSLAIAKRLGDKSTLALAGINSSYGAFWAGDLAAARSLLDEALIVAMEIKHPIRIVSAQLLAAQEANATGDHDRARAALGDALELVRDRGRVIDRLELLTELAHAVAGTDAPFAGRLLGAADADYARRNVVRPSPAAKRYEALHTALADALGQAELGRRLEEGAALTLDEAIDEAFAHEHGVAATVSEVA
jgi:non-specific serine/threonine protein kinase